LRRTSPLERLDCGRRSDRGENGRRLFCRIGVTCPRKTLPAENFSYLRNPAREQAFSLTCASKVRFFMNDSSESSQPDGTWRSGTES
jgi:hypothetical protein